MGKWRVGEDPPRLVLDRGTHATEGVGRSGRIGDLVMGKMWLRFIIVVWLAVALAVASGCGTSGADAGEPGDPIAGLKEDPDPDAFIEVLLGEFFMTKIGKGKRLYALRFKLYGLVPRDQQEAFLASMERFEKRMRDAVFTEIGKMTIAELADPRMQVLRARLLDVIQRLLRFPDLQDVVFSEFTLEAV